MATLHVRNVPDPLYDALRDSAAENGRSIGAEAIDVITRGLFGGRRRFPRPGSVGRPGGRAAFDPEARSAVAAAQDAARELGHDHVRTEHLLLALAAVPGSYTATLLAERGVDVEALCERVVTRVGRGEEPTTGVLPFGPDAKQALEVALRESMRARCRAIRPVHVLLGLLAAEGAAVHVLADLGIDPVHVRTAPFRAPVIRRRAEPDEFRVVELEGSSEDWERQLNEAAGDGYELEQVVGTRAVFRRP